MEFAQRTRSWEISHLANIAGDELSGEGAILFLLRNEHHVRPEPILFTSPAIGRASAAGGQSADLIVHELTHTTQQNAGHSSRLDWSALNVEKPFSFADLEHSVGTVSQLSVLSLVGFGSLALTAANPVRPLFQVNSFGREVGAGRFVASYAGHWSLLRQAWASSSPVAKRLHSAWPLRRAMGVPAA